jgi:hypothetical protein
MSILGELDYPYPGISKPKLSLAPSFCLPTDKPLTSRGLTPGLGISKL